MKTKTKARKTSMAILAGLALATSADAAALGCADMMFTVKVVRGWPSDVTVGQSTLEENGIRTTWWYRTQNVGISFDSVGSGGGACRVETIRTWWTELDGEWSEGPGARDVASERKARTGA